VIVEILVATGVGQHALRDQLLQRVLDHLGLPEILEAPRKAPDQSAALRHLAQQQHPRIRAHPSGVERCHHVALGQTLELKLTRRTLRLVHLVPPVASFSLGRK